MGDKFPSTGWFAPFLPFVNVVSTTPPGRTKLPQLIHQIDVKRKNWATRWPPGRFDLASSRNHALTYQTAVHWWPVRFGNLILRCPGPFPGRGRCLVDLSPFAGFG